MAVRRRRLITGLVAVQLLDGAFDCVPTSWIKNSLDHFGLPEEIRFVLAAMKGASAVGLLLGTRRAPLGRLTALALIGYFLSALGFHARAKDPFVNHLPAVVMLGWSVMALRCYE
jgi:DoxX-like family